MRIVAFGLSAFALLMATPVVAQSRDDIWRRAESCGDDADTALCWLRISAAFMQPQLLRLDPDLIHRPDVLEAIGVEPLRRSAIGPPPAPEPAREVWARRRGERDEADLRRRTNSDRTLAALLASPDAMAAYDPAGERRRMDAEAWHALILDRMAIVSGAGLTGRTSLAKGTAAVLLEMGMLGREDRLDSAAVRSALNQLTPARSPEQLATMATRIEAAARVRRGIGLQNLLPAAHAAWLAAGRPDRAEALIAEWSPLARAQAVAFESGDDPDGVLKPDNQPGALQGVQAILVILGRDAEAEGLGWMSPSAGLWRDFETGVGVERLDSRLEGRREEDRRQILSTCVTLAAGRLETEAAERCATLLLDMDGTWQHRMLAAELAMSAAKMTANLDEPDRAVRLTRSAVAVGAQAERERPAGIMVYSSEPVTELASVATAIIRQRPLD